MRVRFRKRLWGGALAAAIALGGCGGRDSGPGAVTREIAFATADGYTIAGTLYPVERAKPAGLILLPMLGTTRDRWRTFALMAQARGLMSLAIDVRGHGDSVQRSGAKTSYKSFTDADWLAATNDIAAAKQALVAAGADPDNLAVVGASIGANLALRYAADDSTVQAAVLVSPGKDYHGVTVEDAILRMRERPVLLLAAMGDAYSADSCSALKALAAGHCELHEYPGAAHGTDLLDSNENAAGQILLWLTSILGGSDAKGGA